MVLQFYGLRATLVVTHKMWFTLGFLIGLIYNSSYEQNFILMDGIENNAIDDNAQIASSLSYWTGPDVMPMAPSQQVRRSDTAATFDTIDWCSRLFSVGEIRSFPDGWDIGPASMSSSRDSFLITKCFRSVDILKYAFAKYFAVSWDSIDFRITVTDPKNLVGGIHVGWWPYWDQYDKNSHETVTDTIFGDDLLTQGFFNGPYTQLMCFGMSKDVAFTVPWTYKFPLFETRLLEYFDETEELNRAPFGSPVIWWYLLDGSAFVTSVTNPARMNIFFKFNNLRWFGPTNDPRFMSAVERQSGAAVVGAAASAIAASVGVDVISDTLNDLLVPKEDIEEYADVGTFDLPQAVQLAYLGDTTSCGYPNTTPIFKTSRKVDRSHTPNVLEMLRRPQFLVGLTTAATSPLVFSNDPMSFQWYDPFEDVPGAKPPKAHYFRWFGMCNRYWRGTVIFHVVVAGHPLVQVQLDARVSYKGYQVNGSQVMTDIFRDLSTFAGSKHFKFPLPFLTMADYLPINDAYPADDVDGTACTTKLSLSMTVISTMLDTPPTIPAFIYVSAAPDFGFYQPYPPGLYRVSELSVERRRQREKRDKKLVLQAQVQLPMEDEAQIARSRYHITSDPGTMINLPTVYDYMKIWSRAIPFEEYDSEEPIPYANIGFKSATWYPAIDRSADLDSLNSWYQTVDYVAYYSMQFLLYAGEIGFKISMCTDPDVRPQGAYIYATLADPPTSTRQMTHTEFTYSDAQVPPDSNFGAGTVITPGDKQPILEGTIPYRGTNIWSFTSNNVYSMYAQTSQPPNADVDTNVMLANDDAVLADAMFRKIGQDFVLGFETILPPPTMWIARGGPWESPVRGQKKKAKVGSRVRRKAQGKN